MTNPLPATVMAGIPEINATLYRRLRFSVGDPAVLIELPSEGEGRQSILILRDIEMQRAREHARADRIACPADYAPEEGLSGDRETATAQAAAECLRRAGVQRVVGDRSLPLLFAEKIAGAGIAVECDRDADDVAAPAETPLPKRVTEYHYEVTGSDILVGAKAPAQNGLDTEQRKGVMGRQDSR